MISCELGYYRVDSGIDASLCYQHFNSIEHPKQIDGFSQERIFTILNNFQTVWNFKLEIDWSQQFSGPSRELLPVTRVRNRLSLFRKMTYVWFFRSALLHDSADSFFLPTMNYMEDVKNFRSVLIKYDLQKYFRRCSSFMKEYPALTVIAGVVTAFYTVPIAVYIAFSIAAFVLTFVGFLIILGNVYSRIVRHERLNW